MIVKLLTKHHLEFLSLKGGCRGSSESTLVKISNCWGSIYNNVNSCLGTEWHKCSTIFSSIFFKTGIQPKVLLSGLGFVSFFAEKQRVKISIRLLRCYSNDVTLIINKYFLSDWMENSISQIRGFHITLNKAII